MELVRLIGLSLNVSKDEVGSTTPSWLNVVFKRATLLLLIFKHHIQP